MSRSSSAISPESDILVQEFPELPYDRYRICQHIGKGAFSIVYLAYTPEYKRRAIKRIRLTAKPHQIMREIEFLRKLEGKENVVQIKEIRFSMSTLQTTVITNFCDSDDFKTVIYDFTPRDIQRYIKAIIIPLAHCERANVLHRDVKPGNFLYCRKTGEALLIDFGLAQTLREAEEFPIVRSKTRRRIPLGRPTLRELPFAGFVNRELSRLQPLAPQPHSGTHGYRAPEILVSVSTQDSRIDTWSVGVIMIQMLTGKTSLFRGNPTTDLYELTAIRALIGVDRFTQGVGKIGGDFSLTAGVPMPQNISLEEMTAQLNPDLFAVLPSSAYDLCRKLLGFEPQSRIKASEALNHPFLTTPPEELPDCRFQNGAASALPPMPARDIGSHMAALMRKAKGIVIRAGLPQDTADNLAEEYVISVPATDLQALPKEHRKLVERCMEKWKMAESQYNGPGPSIIRKNPGDYVIPASCGLETPGRLNPATLARPIIATTPGFGVGPSAEAWAIEHEIEEEEKNTGRTITKVEAIDRIWERCNRDKEIWESTVRLTAVRRRLDPWIQPLKALDRELRSVQHDARVAAEHYRLTLIEQGTVSVPDPAARQAAVVAIAKMHETIGPSVRPMVDWVRDGIAELKKTGTVSAKTVGGKPAGEGDNTENITDQNGALPDAEERKPESIYSDRLERTPPLRESEHSVKLGYRFPSDFRPGNISMARVTQNLVARQLIDPTTRGATRSLISASWRTAARTALLRARRERERRDKFTVARERAYRTVCTQRLALRGLDESWAPRTTEEFEERLRLHQRLTDCKTDDRDGGASTSPDSELWSETITASDDSNDISALRDENDTAKLPSTISETQPDLIIYDIEKHMKTLVRRLTRRRNVRRAEAIRASHTKLLEEIQSDKNKSKTWNGFDAEAGTFRIKGDSFIPLERTPSPPPLARDSTPSESEECDATAEVRRPNIKYPGVTVRHEALLPRKLPENVLSAFVALEAIRRRSSQQSPVAARLLAGFAEDNDVDCVSVNAAEQIVSFKKEEEHEDPVLAKCRELRAQAAENMASNVSRKRFLELLSHPSTRFLVPFKQLSTGHVPQTLEDVLPIGVQAVITGGLNSKDKSRLVKMARHFTRQAESYFASEDGKKDIISALKYAQAELDKEASGVVAGRREDENVNPAGRPPDLEQMLGLAQGSLSSVPAPCEGRSTSRSRPSRVLSDPVRVGQRYPLVGSMVQEFIDSTLLHTSKLPNFAQNLYDSLAQADRYIRARRLYLAISRLWERTSREIDILGCSTGDQPGEQAALKAAMDIRRSRMKSLAILTKAFLFFGAETVFQVLVGVAQPAVAIVRASKTTGITKSKPEVNSIIQAIASDRAKKVIESRPQLPETKSKRTLRIATDSDISRAMSEDWTTKISSDCAARLRGSAALRSQLLSMSRRSRTVWNN